jgi:hypothetical protein
MSGAPRNGSAHRRGRRSAYLWEGIVVTFSVYFDGPFWVGVLEVVAEGRLRVARHVFGSEPTDAEVYEFLLRHGGALLDRAEAAPAVPVDAAKAKRVNPKRAAKLAARAAARVTTRSTASQEAMRLAIEEGKRAAESDREAAARARDEHRREVRRRRRRARRRGH